MEARQRMLGLLAAMPEGGSLEQFLPVQTADEIPARVGLRRRSA